MNGLVSLEPRELDEFVRCWERWFDAGDYERMAGFYAEDARLVATQVATVEGRPAISSAAPSTTTGSSPSRSADP
jgi:ketosteroid isomerase-like protein